MIDKFNTLLIEDNNRITVKTLSIYMYILKRTRLTLKMTTANCHVICKREIDMNTSLCVRTHPFRPSLFMTK